MGACLTRYATQERTLTKWDEPISPIYGLALRLCAETAAPLDERRAWAARMAAVISTGIPEDVRYEVACDGDAAELLWSTAVALGYLSEDPNLILESLGWVIGLPAELSHHSRTAKDLDTALRLMRGDDPAATLRAVDAATPLYGYPDDGFHLPSNGAAPSLNRNRVTAPQVLITRIDEWVLEQFPVVDSSA